MEVLEIKLDSPENPEVARLLDLHLELMRSVTPPESVYALDHKELSVKSVSLWSVWQDSELCGCCALKEHSSQLAEIKSMHSRQDFRRKGIGQAMLEHLIATSKTRGYKELKLETGKEEAFIAARTLYEKYDFEYCGPFADYTLDPNSVYMKLTLD